MDGEASFLTERNRNSDTSVNVMCKMCVNEHFIDEMGCGVWQAKRLLLAYQRHLLLHRMKLSTNNGLVVFFLFFFNWIS